MKPSRASAGIGSKSRLTPSAPVATSSSAIWFASRVRALGLVSSLMVRVRAPASHEKRSTVRTTRTPFDWASAMSAFQAGSVQPR